MAEGPPIRKLFLLAGALHSEFKELHRTCRDKAPG